MGSRVEASRAIEMRKPFRQNYVSPADSPENERMAIVVDMTHDASELLALY